MITSISFVGTQSEASLTIMPAGPAGPAGPTPDHAWSGTSLRFQLPAGGWGDLTDLRGPAPEHDWVGTGLRFRLPGGAWGNAVDLKGATGGTGTIEVGDIITVAYDDPADVRNAGTSTTAVLDFDIPAGPGVELQKTTTHVQYRLQGGATWTNLVALADILGYSGWSPELAVVSDEERRVLQVADWFGGEGDEPAAGQYVGATGLVVDIADAVDVRGGQGLPGIGTMEGPDTSTDGKLALWDGATGQVLKDSTYAPADFATASQGTKADSAIQPEDLGFKQIGSPITMSGTSATVKDLPQTLSELMLVFASATNSSGVGRSVQIELSTDNGSTFGDVVSTSLNKTSLDAALIFTGFALDKGEFRILESTFAPSDKKLNTSTLTQYFSRHVGGCDAMRLSLSPSATFTGGTLTIYGR